MRLKDKDRRYGIDAARSHNCFASNDFTPIRKKMGSNDEDAPGMILCSSISSLADASETKRKIVQIYFDLKLKPHQHAQFNKTSYLQSRNRL